MIYIYNEAHPELGLPLLVVYKANLGIKRGDPVRYVGDMEVRMISEPHPSSQFSHTVTLRDSQNAVIPIETDVDLPVCMVDCLGFAQDTVEDGQMVKVWVQPHQRLAVR